MENKSEETCTYEVIEDNDKFAMALRSREKSLIFNCVFCSVLTACLTAIIYKTGDKSLMWWYIAPVLCYLGAR